jgi:hypothetical protein
MILFLLLCVPALLLIFKSHPIKEKGEGPQIFGQ